MSTKLLHIWVCKQAWIVPYWNNGQRYRLLVAQALNQDDKTIFGCYLLGKDWHFTSLHNNRYCFSASYDATRPTELAQIIHILAHLKHFIHP